MKFKLLTIQLIAIMGITNIANAQNFTSNSQALQQIEKTLIFSDLDEIKAKEQGKSNFVIDKSPSNNQNGSSQVQIVVVEADRGEEIQKKTKMAYSAILVKQYEVAIELYKQILKLEPNDKYIQFSLATAYHELKQYKQAKTIYHDLLRSNPDNKNEIIGNLLDIIIEESPMEAVYFLDKLAAQNPKSADLLARSAMVYDKTGKQDQAILLLDRAIKLDPQNHDYKLNLAIIYDKMKEVKKALPLYKKALRGYKQIDNIDKNQIIIEIQNRIDFITNS
ncbi:MAG: tetratricopeptide repeat protein [Proteobacteria bacterium]|nr:tetratricopeptide repeat protein [Pseudomonadota bacterium]